MPTPYDAPYDETNCVYSCVCGWWGKAGYVQISRKHYLDFLGVLKSHVKGLPGVYQCKVCGKQNDRAGLDKCLYDHHALWDGVVTVKDAYGREHVYKGSFQEAQERERRHMTLFNQAHREQLAYRDAPARGGGYSTRRY